MIGGAAAAVSTAAASGPRIRRRMSDPAWGMRPVAVAVALRIGRTVNIVPRAGFTVGVAEAAAVVVVVIVLISAATTAAEFLLAPAPILDAVSPVMITRDAAPTAMSRVLGVPANKIGEFPMTILNDFSDYKIIKIWSKRKLAEAFGIEFRSRSYK